MYGEILIDGEKTTMYEVQNTSLTCTPNKLPVRMQYINLMYEE
jgi:hypothetical protein